MKSWTKSGASRRYTAMATFFTLLAIAASAVTASGARADEHNVLACAGFGTSWEYVNEPSECDQYTSPYPIRVRRMSGFS